MARTGTQAAHAHLHGIECVERLGLNSLMRALVWLLECHGECKTAIALLTD